MLADFIRSVVRRLMPVKKNGDFRRRIRYSLKIENKASLDNVFEWTCSRTQLALACIGAFVLVGIVALSLVNMSPLRRVLPTAMSGALRDDYEEMSIKLDSLNQASSAALAYAMNINRIIHGEEADQAMADTTMSGASTLPLDSLMEASSAERAFVQRFEDEERFNLSVLAPIAATGMTFYPPVLGAEPEVSISDAGIPYLRFSGGSTGVSSVYRGTVVNSYYTSDRGVTVSVQHPNDFISIYSGLTDSFVTRGDKVNAGTRLGENRDANRPLTFELWHKGTPLLASEYISF